jgi:ribosomal protein S18 acetylase RimI-like enzyme
MDMFPMSRTLINNLLPDVGAAGAAVAARPAAVAIRPARPDDVEAIMAMHQRLSADTLYSRYHSPRMPSRMEVAGITRLNGDGVIEDGVTVDGGRALLAVLPGRRGAVVGLAYYVVTGPETAEVAFLVEDAYQGQGIGRRLVRALSQEAQAAGIRYFDADVLAANQPMLRLLRQHGRVVYERRVMGALEMRLRLN